MPLISSRQLTQGPLILGCSTRSFRTAAIALFIKAGSRFEVPSNRGVSHLLEHLLFRGSQRYTAREIVCWVEGQGGTINAFTSEECTCLHLQIFPANWKKALDILLDMASHPLLDQEDIDRERSIVLDEAKSQADHPISLLGDLFSKSLWGKHPLGNSIEGTARSLRGLQREKLQQYLAKHYRPNSCAIAFAGDLDIDDMAKSIQQNCTSWGQNIAEKRRKKTPMLDGGQDLFCRKKLEQVHFQIGLQLHSLSDHERCAQSLLSVLLGESMTSRLFQKVREKEGLAYHLHSECSHHTDISAMSIQAIASKERFGQCLDQIQQQIKRLNIDLIDEGELKRAKSYLLGTTLAELENPMGLALWLGDQLFSGWSGNHMTPERYEALIDSIDLAQVQRAARSLRSIWRGTFVGPKVLNWDLEKWQSWSVDQALSNALSINLRN